MSNLTTLKDANGNDFQIDLAKISDINGDLNPETKLQDSVLKNRIAFEHDTEIVDVNGTVLDSTQLLKDMSNGSTNVVAVDVETEATHSGKNHNYCIYYEDSMEKDSESFLNPFHKPMLKNHNDYSEPLGRITSSYSGPSKLTDERSAIHLKVRVTDQDAIPKFIDKRYGTVSIGGSMGTVTCNVCGKTILKDGKFRFCGHMRGETYKDQLCYWGVRDIEYNEVSVVNNPADDFAQITKVTVLTDKDIQKNNDKEESSMHETGDNTETNDIDHIVDATLENNNVQDSVENKESEAAVPENAEDNNSESDTNVSDSKTTENESSETKGNANTDTEDENSKDSDTSVEDSDANAEDLKKQLEDAQSKIDSLQQEVIDLQSQVKSYEKVVDDNKKEIEVYKDRCVTLATANKEYVVDSIISKENFKTEDEEKERRNDLMVKSMKDLKTIQSENSKTIRDLAHVDNPTLAVDDPSTTDSNSNSSSKKADTEINDSESIRSVDDAAQEIIKRLIK